jgi:hypothetical protein
MSVVDGGPGTASLISRIQNILLKPKAEWEVIAGETATNQSLFMGYAAILAAIPAVAHIIGGFFPACAFGICVHLNPIFIILGGIVSYVVSLAGTFVIGLIIDALAPSFGGEKNPIAAMKVAVYSFTAAWLAGIFGIVPMLGILSIVGLYSLYLLYLGLPVLMKAPQDKALVYTIVAVICGIVVFIVAGLIGGAVTSMGAVGGGAVNIGAMGGPSGTVSVNGQSVDLGKMQAAANQIAASANAAQSGKAAPAIDPEKLKALLPDTIAGMPRTELSSSSVGAAGGASNVEAVYSNDTNRITVTVTDMAAMQGLAAMAGAMNVNSSHETATGYDKVSTVNGRMTTEEWDRQSKNGKYGVVVANRFSVEASGSAASIDDLKSAVAAVGPDRLEGLAHG